MDLRAIALSVRALPLLLAGAGLLPAWVGAQAVVEPGGGPASAASASATASAPASAAANVALGRRAYTSYCTRCHGINLVVSGSAFYDLRTFPKGDRERFMRSVSKGLRAMPAWEGIVKPEEMESIWLYVASVNGW